jgi:hypothetical protein
LQNMQNNMLQTRPVNTTGTIYTPSGQMYRYNSTSY